jgi:hypothetical protein
MFSGIVKYLRIDLFNGDTSCSSCISTLQKQLDSEKSPEEILAQAKITETMCENTGRNLIHFYRVTLENAMELDNNKYEVQAALYELNSYLEIFKKKHNMN